MKKIFKIFVMIVPVLVIFSVVFSPVVANADIFRGIVPSCKNDNCGWGDLIELARKLVNYLILISAPIAAIVFAYAGFLLTTAGPDTGKRETAKKLFLNATIGFIFVLVAWLIVYTITNALLTSAGYSILQDVK